MVHSVLAEAAAGPSSTTIISILGGLIAALIAVAGGVGTWAALRVAKNSQLVANYQGAAESWEARANGLKAEKEGLEDQLKDVMETNASLRAKNAALQDMATGHPAIEQMAASMDRGFQVLADQLTRIESNLGGSGHV